jgi:phosphate transport system substrate-binding protein
VTKFAIVLLLLVTPLAGAQTPAGTDAPGRPLVVTGASTIYPLMIDIARRFEGQNPGVAVEVRSVGTGKGLADLRAGISDIAMVSRQLVDNERDLFSFPLCRDGAAIVVHRSNPLKGLSRQQLTSLLTGKTTDWKQLGPRAGAVTLIWRTEQQAIPELILRHLKLEPRQIRSHAIIFDNAEAVALVAKDRNAITLVALGVAERSVKAGAPVKLLAYEGIAASTHTVRERTYLLSRPLLLVTRSIPEGAPKRLIDYAVSRAVNDLHEKHGFVAFED